MIVDYDLGKINQAPPSNKCPQSYSRIYDMLNNDGFSFHRHSNKKEYCAIIFPSILTQEPMIDYRVRSAYA